MLSHQGSLRSSTHEGGTRVTHASRRNSASVEFQGQEVLFLWDTLRCSTHLNIRWGHCKILRPMHNFLKMPLQEPDFFWFMSDAFLKRHVLSYWDSYEKFLQGDLQWKWYWKGLLIALLEESCKEYLQASLQADSALTRRHEKRASTGTLKNKKTARKGRWAISPDSRASHPLRF